MPPISPNSALKLIAADESVEGRGIYWLSFGENEQKGYVSPVCSPFLGEQLLENAGLNRDLI